MRSRYSITLEDSLDSEAARVVQDGLYQYNLPYAGEDNYKELAVFVREEWLRHRWTA